MANPTLIDLFSGCGGMTLGFRDQGFEPVMAVEQDLAAAATYAANFGEGHMRPVDIASVVDEDIPSVDVVIGGPPCQGFSHIGLRNVEDPRNQLWREFMRFVRVAKPKVFVIENVDRFLKSPEFEMLSGEVREGALADYEITSSVLNSADFGVPQRRRRTIIIGSRVGPIAMPSPTHVQPPRDQQLQWDGDLDPWVTVRDAIAGLPERPTESDLPEKRVEFFGQSFKGPFSGHEIHFRRNPTDLSLRRYSYIPPGGGRFNLPYDLMSPCWQKKATGTTDVMGRMRWEAPSVTIRTEFFKPEKGAYLHPQWQHSGATEVWADKEYVRGDPDHSVDRVITHLEASLIQDFPDDFVWVGGKTEIARQIGNAVPRSLAAAIAGQVSRHL